MYRKRQKSSQLYPGPPRDTFRGPLMPTELWFSCQAYLPSAWRGCPSFNFKMSWSQQQRQKWWESWSSACVNNRCACPLEHWKKTVIEFPLGLHSRCTGRAWGQRLSWFILTAELTRRSQQEFRWQSWALATFTTTFWFLRKVQVAATVLRSLEFWHRKAPSPAQPLT